MKNICIGISQIQNAPNNPYYKDSRMLRVIISPPEQNQFILLSGLETLTTGQKLNFKFSDPNSFLTFVLMETKPNNFDIAYLTISLGIFHPNSIIKESQVMKAVVSGINNPLITFDIQITSIITESMSSSPQNAYQPRKIKNSRSGSQDPFIPNNLDFSAIIRFIPPLGSQTNNIFLQQNDIKYSNEASCLSSDYDEEEEMIINSRIYFNDETAKLLNTPQSPNKSLTSITQQQQQKTKNTISRNKSNTLTKKPSFIIEDGSNKPSEKEKNSLPFVPPEENDAPFLLPKQLPTEHSKSQDYEQNKKQNQIQQNKQKRKSAQPSLQPKKQYSQQYFVKQQYIQSPAQQYPQQQCSQQYPQQQYSQQYPQQNPQVMYPKLQEDQIQTSSFYSQNSSKYSNNHINRSSSSEDNSNAHQSANYPFYPQLPPNPFQ